MVEPAYARQILSELSSALAQPQPSDISPQPSYIVSLVPCRRRCRRRCRRCCYRRLGFHSPRHLERGWG